MPSARLPSADLPFDPCARLELPSFDEARRGLLGSHELGGLKPRAMADVVNEHLRQLFRIHYHQALVGIVRTSPDIAGLRLRGPATMSDMRLSLHATAEARPDLPKSAVLRAVRMAESRLSNLRGALPADKALAEFILRLGPLTDRESFLLTPDNASAYLSRLRVPDGLGPWLAGAELEESLAGAIAHPTSQSHRPRM